MSSLNRMAKINFQVAENADNIARSRGVCEDAGLDTTYTMGEALTLFRDEIHLNKHGDERAKFHDAMHIIALECAQTARAESLTGITEHTLLREPYNGNENDLIEKGYRYLYYAHRSFNPAGHEDFEEPAPVSDFNAAKALGEERLSAVYRMVAKTRENPANISETDMRQAYDRAVEIDDYFKSLMGGRAVYQLSLRELESLPLCFFGVQKGDSTTENALFTDIPPQVKRDIQEKAIQANNTNHAPLHRVERVKTEAELRALYPQSPHLETLHSDF